jgi:hypothetical protein
MADQQGPLMGTTLAARRFYLEVFSSKYIHGIGQLPCSINQSI